MLSKLCFPRSFAAWCGIAVAGLIGSVTAHAAELRITEVMSSSGGGGTADWFEVTNYGVGSVDITGFTMDDGSFSFASSVALNGVTTITSGETVVFLETAAPLTDIPAFRTFWGGSAVTATIGSYTGSGVSFGSGGDGVVLFNGSGVAQTPQTSFGAATTGSSFYWAYDDAGDFVTGFGTQSAGLVSNVGTISGSLLDQVGFTSADALANIGSPGTAAVAVPEPSTYALLAGIGSVGLMVYRSRRRAAA